jgi:hypothetical protein
MAFSLLGHFDPQLAGRMVNRPYIATAFGENLAIRRNAPRTPRQKINAVITSDRTGARRFSKPMKQLPPGALRR